MTMSASPNTEPTVRLFCLPHAGAGASTYRPWAALLPGGVTLTPLQPPGREERLSEPPFTNIRETARSLVSMVMRQADRPFFLFGHSMGAHALVQAAALAPGRFSRLILIDPVIAAPQAYHQPPPTFPGGEHPAARRQSRFASPQAMIERFATRMPYALFDPQALRDYCEHGLVPAPDGAGWALACDPRTEAAVYMTGRGNPGVYASIRALEIPVLVVRARLPTPDRNPFDYSFSPTWPGLAAEFRRGREIHVADRSHFLPMEAPAQVADIIRDELAGHTDASRRPA